MLICKDIEKKIMDALTAAFTAASVTAPPVDGVWQTSLSGVSKWLDGSSDDSAIVTVSVSTPGQETFSLPVANLTGTIGVLVRPELDLDGQRLCAVTGVICDLLRSWQASTYQQPFTALDVTGFSVDEISVSQGSVPSLDQNRVIVNFPFTLSGSYQPITNN